MYKKLNHGLVLPLVFFLVCILFVHVQLDNIQLYKVSSHVLHPSSAGFGNSTSLSQLSSFSVVLSHVYCPSVCSFINMCVPMLSAY